MTRFLTTTILTGIFILPANLLAHEVDSTTESREALEVTIYQGNLAQVRDSRTLSLTTGRHPVNLLEVSGQILPATARLAADGLRLVETNFNYDLLTAQKLLEKSVGQTVRVYRADPTGPADIIEEATVLSAVGGEAVLQFEDRIEVLSGQGLPGRIVFDSIPENLRAKPTLSTLVDVKNDFEGTADLTYMTRGLMWNANYVAVYDEEANSLSLQAWATIVNNTGVAFEDTSLKLVAGEVRDVLDGPARREAVYRADEMMVSESRTASMEGLASYYLYAFSQNTDLLNAQTKQLELFNAPSVEAEKWRQAYDYGTPSTVRTQTQWGVRFENREEEGLGLPLPEGTLSLYQADSDEKLQFVGSSSLDNTPRDVTVELLMGKDFDVSYEGRVLGEERTPLAGDRALYTRQIEVTFRNGGEEAAVVDYIFNAAGEEASITVSSLDFGILSSNRFEWHVPVSARGETVLSFTVEFVQSR